MPRSVIFKNGEEVGRLLFYKTPEELTEKLNELMATGRILTEASDAEEVTRFYTRVQEALGWEFKRDFPHEQWQGKADELMKISHEIIESRPEWSLLGPTEMGLPTA